jgi:SAM-dependent methyltransferase
MEAVKPREPQYAPCFDAEPVVLGPMASESFRKDPKHLGFMLARYKFVSKMLAGYTRVAEIGCGDGTGSAVVNAAVHQLDLFDFDPAWEASARRITGCPFRQHDIIEDYIRGWSYSAIYMLDVIEHITPEAEPKMLANVVRSLDDTGIFVVGTPSLESQIYASSQSREGHVNCRSGEKLRYDIRGWFDNVFLFGMNDEVLHVGFTPMCHYLFAVATGPKKWMLHR